MSPMSFDEIVREWNALPAAEKARWIKEDRGKMITQYEEWLEDALEEEREEGPYLERMAKRDPLGGYEDTLKERRAEITRLRSKLSELKKLTIEKESPKAETIKSEVHAARQRRNTIAKAKYELTQREAEATSRRQHLGQPGAVPESTVIGLEAEVKARKEHLAALERGESPETPDFRKIFESTANEAAFAAVKAKNTKKQQLGEAIESALHQRVKPMSEQWFDEGYGRGKDNAWWERVRMLQKKGMGLQEAKDKATKEFEKK